MNNLKDYYCIKAIFFGTELTMSVNVMKDDNINYVYERALYYFNKMSKWPVHKMVLYNTESDRWSERNVKGIHIVKERELG